MKKRIEKSGQSTVSLYDDARLEDGVAFCVAENVLEKDVDFYWNTYARVHCYLTDAVAENCEWCGSSQSLTKRLVPFYSHNYNEINWICPYCRVSYSHGSEPMERCLAGMMNVLEERIVDHIKKLQQPPAYLLKEKPYVVSGEKVRKSRLELGVTQKLIGEISGLHASYICNLERGKLILRNAKKTEALANALGVDVSSIIE